MVNSFLSFITLFFYVQNEGPTIGLEYQVGIFLQQKWHEKYLTYHIALGISFREFGTP